MNRKQRRKANVKPRTEWHGASDFHEFAEALGIKTTQIMAVRPFTESIVVLYTLTDDSELLHSVHLRRGVDGVLFRASQPTPHPGMWESIVADANRGIDADLRKLEREGKLPPRKDGE